MLAEDVLVLIDGGDYTAYTRLDGFLLNRTLNAPDEFSCDIDTDDGSFNFGLDKNVIVTNVFPTPDSARLFGGHVSEPSRQAQAESALDAASAKINLTANDYNALATRYLVAGDYPEDTLKNNIQKLLTDTGLFSEMGIGLDGTQVDGPTMPARTYDYISAKDVLDEWTVTSGGYLWKVNQYGALSMFAPGSATAPFDIADGDGNTVGDVKVTPMRDGFANWVVVRAGTVTSIASDSGSITARGRWSRRYDAADGIDSAAADALAASILTQTLVEKTQVVYQTFQDGLEPGQTQSIVLSDRGLNNTFLITQVQMRFEAQSDQFVYTVTAVEGTAKQSDWRDTYKQWSSGSGSGSAIGVPGGGGGGSSTGTKVYPLGGVRSESVRSVGSPVGWVAATGCQAGIDTVERGTPSAQVTVMLGTSTAGITVKARLYDLSNGVDCGQSTTVTGSVDANGDPVLTRKTFTVTLTAGSNVYELQILPSAVEEEVLAVGAFVE